MKKLLVISFIFLTLIGCSREENEERRALSHCADIKLINFLNANPEIIINRNKRSEIIEILIKRDQEIEEWTKLNHDTKDLMGVGKLRKKMDNLSDPINFDLFGKYLSIFGEVTDITSLNEKTIDWKVDAKKEKFYNYAKYHLDCWNEYKKDNGYYSKEFIKKYSEWQKQDVSNLGKITHLFFKEIFKYSENFIFTSQFEEYFTKLLPIVPK